MSYLLNPFIHGVAGAPATLTYRGSNVSAGAATHTYTAAPIGTADADRRVIVAIGVTRSSGAGRAISSVTIGGNAATVHATITDATGATGSMTAGVASVLVPSGTTANVVVTFNGTPAGSQIAVYTATGTGGIISTVTANSNDPSTSTLNAAAGGCIVAAFASNSSGAGMTMTGVTEDADATGSSGQFGAGSASGLAAQTGRTIAVSSSAAFEALAAVSWSTVAAAINAPPLDGLAATGAWSMSRDLFTAFAGGTRYTTATGVNSLNDQSGNARHFAQATAANQPTVTTAGPNSRACADFDGTSDLLASSTAITFITNTAGYIVASFIADAVTTNVANPYDNNPVFADNGGFVGVHLKNTGTPATVLAYNWDGSADAASSATIATGTPYVVEWRHDSTSVYLRINGGSEVSAASGSTTNLTNALNLGGRAAVFGNIKVFEAAAFSTPPNLADRNTLAANLMAHIGAT